MTDQDLSSMPPETPSQGLEPAAPESGQPAQALLPVAEPAAPAQPRPTLLSLLVDLLLLVILLAAAYLRFSGLDWGEYQYLHPDERFLVWVGADIATIGNTDALGLPPNSANPGYEWRRNYADVLDDCAEWGGYFDAACSPLNPQNRGHYFYVYGTLPMFATRYLAETLYEYAGWNQILDVGRSLSAGMDLLTVFMVFLIGHALYGRRAGLWAAAFAAVQVLPIQQAHFFTMDTFANFFGFVAVYFAVLILRRKPVETAAGGWLRRTLDHPYTWLSLGFGAAYGLALASKLSIYPLAFLLPGVFFIVWLRLPRQERPAWVERILVYLVVGGLAALLVFRLGQPYAFRGPSFFNVLPNPAWVSNIVEQRNQAAGDVDFPPSLQWARRSVLFSGENLVKWGLGWPLALLAWAGFLWAGWRMLRGEWHQHALLWGWVAFHFIWQSLQFNPTMRYQLPIYPALAVFAGWAIPALSDQVLRWRKQPRRWLAPTLAGLLGLGVLIATAAWAFGFSSIYARPITRIAASYWIFDNIPGAINLQISGAQGDAAQVLGYPYNYTLQEGIPYTASFTARQSGLVTALTLGDVRDAAASGLTGSSPGAGLEALIVRTPDGTLTNAGAQVLSITSLDIALTPQGRDLYQELAQSVAGAQGDLLYIFLRDPINQREINFCGEMLLYLRSGEDSYEINLAAPQECILPAGGVLAIPFVLPANGLVSEVFFSRVAGEPVVTGERTLNARIFTALDPGAESYVEATAQVSSVFEAAGSQREPYTLTFDNPLPVVAGQPYRLVLEVSGPGGLALRGAAVANEGDWDDGLPYRVGGNDAFSGVYAPGLNFNMYTDETEEKRARFKNILDQTEYIFISSNRQWGSLPRLPERFPMSAAYYRALLGCPEDQELFWCYAVAQPGMFQGQLGFELVQVFQSDPQLFGLRINDQFAEEAFHVYDHPKVLIFRKTSDYDSAAAHALLDSVDLSKVVHVTPKKAGPFPATLTLPSETLAQQQAGGTWSELYDRASLLNASQPLGVVVWYLAIWVMGLLAYPLLRLAFPGLPDRGYPLARIAGLLMLGWLVWLAASLGIPFTWATITAVIGLMALLAAALVYWQRAEMRQELREKWRYFLTIEGLFLLFFIIFLLVRLGNPDLWHPAKGGERPMDFTYFNAVLKSTTFPPYDPWYAGGYMNYYYFGFIYSGVLVKWLGLIPSFAFNLILPTMFSLTAMAAFSAAWNLARRAHSAWLAGVGGSLLMVVLGNLGTLRMIARGYQILVDPSLAQEGAGLLTRWSAMLQGMGKALQGAAMPYGTGDWYWNPSRVMPPGDNAITEFPAFTFLYSDPHAHLFALSIALLAFSWALSVLLGKGLGRWSQALGSLFIGALAVGALRPTNTWDSPTYLALGAVALLYTQWRYLDVDQAAFGRLPLLAALPPLSKRFLVIALSLGSFISLSLLFFSPFTAWYGQAYGKTQLWTGPITPLGSYFTHWGLFLFIAVSWMLHESFDWMRSTPAYELRRVRWDVVIILLALLLTVILLLAVKVPVIDPTAAPTPPFGRGIVVALVAIPLGAWAALLLLRPSQSDAKRAALFLIGTTMAISLFVEVVVLQGDIGRQNTVFKLYLQGWTLMSVACGAIFAWLLDEFDRSGEPGGWSLLWANLWQVGLILLVAAAALFPLLGGAAKINDRMAQGVPLTLDGMDYMRYATYLESDDANTNNMVMDLSEDYAAIQWMQDNVQGSPVIVEANSGRLYRWYSRYSIYTGLPGVLGWEWHQIQQRALNPGTWVNARLLEINAFYTTSDVALAQQFLRRYNVRYIIVGQLEKISYPGGGMDKFAALDGQLWREVYNQGQTTIYEVIP